MSTRIAVFSLINGVFVSEAARKKFEAFEAAYLKLRAEENRMLSVAEIRLLPFPEKTHPDYEQWAIRRKNIFRFLNYLDKKKTPLRILDVGCGNGFFTHMMAEKGHSLTGVDVNLPELGQAALAFPDQQINWYYSDLTEEQLPEEKFDLITFCASFQYFSDPQQIIRICQTLLKKAGEIHIIDSPFYPAHETQAAQKRSAEHFKKLGAEQMNGYYHYNTYDSLNTLNYTFAYKPGSFINKLLRRKDSPFPWLIIR